MDCIFCKIAQKEIKSYVVDESENFICLLDINPHSPGHSLILPKDHIVNFVDLPKNLSGELIEFAQKIVKLLSEKLNTSDFTIGINEGKLAGRAVDHLHIHILPRFKDDKGGSIHSIVYNPPKQSLEEIYNLLKK